MFFANRLGTRRRWTPAVGVLTLLIALPDHPHLGGLQVQLLQLKSCGLSPAQALSEQGEEGGVPAPGEGSAAQTSKRARSSPMERSRPAGSRVRGASRASIT